MNEWPAVLAAIASALVICGFTWKNHRDSNARVEGLRNDVAWVNNGLSELKKEVEWLVWHFKRDRER